MVLSHFHIHFGSSGNPPQERGTRQKEKAETYISYRQSLKDIEISLIVHEVKKLKEQADDLRQKIQNTIQLASSFGQLASAISSLTNFAIECIHFVIRLNDIFLFIINF